MKNNFAKITPNPLSLIIPKDEGSIISTNITIENLTNKYLIYQILINKKGIIFVKPASSYILPNQNISVEINNYNKISSKEYKNLKILVMIIPQNKEIKSIEEAKNLFHILKNQEIPKQQILIDLNFVMEEIINTDISTNNNIYDNINNTEEKLNSVNYSNKRSQLISKNEEILENLEIHKKKMEALIEQNNKKNENSKNKANKKYNFDYLIMISIILFGLILGSNFAIGYNKLYNK